MLLAALLILKTVHKVKRQLLVVYTKISHQQGKRSTRFPRTPYKRKVFYCSIYCVFRSRCHFLRFFTVFCQNASGGGHACWVQIGRTLQNRSQCVNYYPLITKHMCYDTTPTYHMCHFVYHTRKFVKYTKTTQSMGGIGENVNSVTEYGA